MGKKRPVYVVTYFGLDGACAAAMVLQSNPDASLRITSARRVAGTLSELAGERPGIVHVCGLGVQCGWDELHEAVSALDKQGSEVHWYCGRKYLDDEKEFFSPLVKLHFVDAGTNTTAVWKVLNASSSFESDLIRELSWFDKHVKGHHDESKMKDALVQWADLIEAGQQHNFKFQTAEPYMEAISSLARNVFSNNEQALVDRYRLTGSKYVLTGRAPSMRALRERLRKCAEANRNVLITGESGSGKEHVAHLLWEGNSRAMEGDILPINCALYAGNPGLANSDLFGHVKGAFTGAHQDRKGRFAEAHGGILYLDEIGDLPLDVQAKLLRVIEDGKVTPEGADRPTEEVDVLIISATNKNLPEMIRDGAFRADLYHRLATLRIHMPPLRDRIEDLKDLAEQRLKELREQRPKAKLTRRDIEAMHAYSWPGNVRQLFKLIDRAIFLDMPMSEVIEEEAALGELEVYGPGREGGDAALPTRKEDVRPLSDVSAEYCRRAWELHNKNYEATSKALKIVSNTLRYTYLGEQKRPRK